MPPERSRPPEPGHCPLGALYIWRGSVLWLGERGEVPVTLSPYWPVQWDE